jgi:hypothetical protein
MPLLDIWFDFASTYSYPAAMRIAPLAALSPVSARAPVQGPRLAYLSVQSVSLKGPLYVDVAGPRADLL